MSAARDAYRTAAAADASGRLLANVVAAQVDVVTRLATAAATALRRVEEEAATIQDAVALLPGARLEKTPAAQLLQGPAPLDGSSAGSQRDSLNRNKWEGK